MFPTSTRSAFSNTGTIRFGGNGTVRPAAKLRTRRPRHGPNLSVHLPAGRHLVPETGTRIGTGPNGSSSAATAKISTTVTRSRSRRSSTATTSISSATMRSRRRSFRSSKRNFRAPTASAPAATARRLSRGEPCVLRSAAVHRFGNGGRESRAARTRQSVPDRRRARRDLPARANGQATTDDYAIWSRRKKACLASATGPRKRRATPIRIVGGLRGDIGDSWNYEVSVNYGQLKEKTKIQGNLNVQRSCSRMTPVAIRRPATSSAARRSIPIAAFGYYPWIYGVLIGRTDPERSERRRSLARTSRPARRSTSLGGNFTQAQRDYLLQDTVAKGKTTPVRRDCLHLGQLAKWFELAGRPGRLRARRRISHGRRLLQPGSRRHARLHLLQRDPVLRRAEGEGEGSVRRNPAADPEGPSVRCTSSKFRAPRACPITSSATTGTVWAYNVNGICSPFNGLRLRGNYARAVRAPNQVELFTPFGQNFAPGSPIRATSIRSARLADPRGELHRGRRPGRARRFRYSSARSAS